MSEIDVTTSTEQGAWRRYLRALGPGLVTGASDDDPSAIATYASAGAATGFTLLWTCVVSFPLMVAVQLNSDRVALATGKSFGELARARAGRAGSTLFTLLLVVHLGGNVLVTAADLVAIGAGASLLGAGPTWLWALVAGAAITTLLLSGSFSTIARVLKVLCISLLAYVAVLAFIEVDWGDVLRRTLVPRLALDGGSARLLLAVLGATLPPYVFFWQNVHRLEELRDEGDDDRIVPLRRLRPSQAARKERTSALDVICGMAFAVVVMFGVIVSLAVSAGGRSIASAADAARALEPVAGSLAKVLFAVGFIAAGALAVPVLAGAGAANLSGLLGRRWGFSRSIGEAPLFYGLVVASTGTGAVLALAGIEPIDLLVLAATVNGFTAAPLLAVVMVVSGDRELLGEHRPGRLLRALGWAAVALMAVAALGALAT